MAEYIDRNALIEHIKKDPLFDLVEQYGITGVIESFPTADVQPVKHGRWEKAQPRGIVSYADCYAECSACHGKPVFLGWDMKFCPNCGAKMDGET